VIEQASRKRSRPWRVFDMALLSSSSKNGGSWVWWQTGLSLRQGICAHSRYSGAWITAKP